LSIHKLGGETEKIAPAVDIEEKFCSTIDAMNPRPQSVKTGGEHRMTEVVHKGYELMRMGYPEMDWCGGMSDYAR
jgi:hypothetical protein